MAKFKGERVDPYKNFKFIVRWEGREVAGMSKVSGLTRSTQVISYREGGDPSSTLKMPGQIEYSPITLERGVTHDPDFEEWANKVWTLGNARGAEMSLKDFRRDIIIDLLNEAGQTAISYKVYRCWVSDYTALPDLDASENGVAIQTITLQNEGWERDEDVTEPDPAEL
jgi:phage tail-like protein